MFSSTALKLLYRARYIALIVIGENHPEVALIDSNIGLILHAVGEYDLSIKFLERALALNIKYHEPRSLKAAVSYHLVGLMNILSLFNVLLLSLLSSLSLAL